MTYDNDNPESSYRSYNARTLALANSSSVGSDFLLNSYNLMLYTNVHMGRY